MKRNQVIDVAKLIFCIGVLFNHTSVLGSGPDSLPLIMQYGFLGVEFFFIVSGFLMTKKAFSDDDLSIGKSTLNFIKRKFCIIYPYFFVAWVIAFIIDIFVNSYDIKSILSHLIKSVPFHLQLSMTGIPVYNIIGPTWYISAMLICMLFMYPLIKKLKYTYVCIFAPLLVLVSYGYLGEMVGHLATIEPLNGGFLHTGLLRGIAGMSLGAISFGLSEYLNKINFSKKGKIALTFLEIIAYLFVIIGMQSQGIVRPDFIVVIFIVIAVTISFSGLSLTQNLFKKDHPIIGQLSLVLYLSDAPARVLTIHLFSDFNRMERIIPAFVLTFVFGLIVLLMGNLLKKAFGLIKDKLNENFVLH